MRILRRLARLDLEHYVVAIVGSRGREDRQLGFRARRPWPRARDLGPTIHRRAEFRAPPQVTRACLQLRTSRRSIVRRRPTCGRARWRAGSVSARPRVGMLGKQRVNPSEWCPSWRPPSLRQTAPAWPPRDRSGVGNSSCRQPCQRRPLFCPSLRSPRLRFRSASRSVPTRPRCRGSSACRVEGMTLRADLDVDLSVFLVLP